ncbi:MAG: alpha/beta fold hydrolase [Fimbriimonas sp.]
MIKHPFLSTVLLVACASAGFAQTTEGTFDSKGVKIRYAMAGEGETVVLIHGWLADSTMWGRDASGNPRLNTTGAEGFRIVALDCRGHGKSDKPHEREKYGAEMAADVVRLLDHLKVARAHLVGYSMGAFIAGKVAATHPKRVQSLVYGGQAPLLKGGKASGPTEVDIFAKAVEDGKGLGPYILAVTPPDRLKLTPEQANTYADFMFKGKDVKALAAAGLSFGDLRVSPEELKRCKAPILFLHGSGESDELKTRIARLRTILGRGELRVVEGADHITTLAKPEFGAALMEFLRAHKAR